MKTYVLKKTNAPLTVADPTWEKLPATELDFRWEDCYPSPYTTVARLCHSEEGITVRLETTEWPLRAARTVCNEQICEDSCMEFFFTPNEEEAPYLNIEINPFGVTHIGLGASRYDRRPVDITGEGLRIETLIRFGEGWMASYFLPYTFIDKYFSARTATWRANFYKCGDLTERKHFSVWNPVELPKPDYHRPEFFGTLVLSDEEV